MTKGKSGAGLQSDGELVQGGADTFVFAPVREDAVGLLLPAVQSISDAPARVPPQHAARTNDEVDFADILGATTFRSEQGEDTSAHGDWIDILTMSPPPPPGDARAGGDDDDDDGLPPTLDWGIDGDGPGDKVPGDWFDLLSTGGGGAVAKGDDDGLPVTLVWDLG
jgi:hypothetical protein